MDAYNFVVEELNKHLTTQEAVLKQVKFYEFGCEYMLSQNLPQYLHTQTKTLQNKSQKAILIYDGHIKMLRETITSIELNPQQLDQIMNDNIDNIASLVDKSVRIMDTLSEASLPIKTQLANLNEYLKYELKHNVSIN